MPLAFTMAPCNENDKVYFKPLLEKVRPDILVKGGDYSVDQVVGADIVKRHGGRVEVLDFVENISTTHIVQKIRSE